MLQVDRLYEAVAEKSPVCVGLDTDFSYIPAECVDKTLSKGENIFRFNRDIIEATRSVAGCFKVQIAYYEALGLDGMLAYKSTLEYLRREGLVAIADIKRGDIAKTAWTASSRRTSLRWRPIWGWIPSRRTRNT